MENDSTPPLRELWTWSDPRASELRFRQAAGSTDGRRRLLALVQAARALGLQDEYDAAHRLLDEVEGLDDDSAEVRASLALERGRVWRSAGRPDEARPFFRDAAGLAEAAGLEALHVDALHMLAMYGDPAEQLQGNLAALEVARGAGADDARRWDASLLNNVGMAQHDLGDLEGALASFEAALALRERRGQVPEARVARWMVAWTLRLLGRTEEALVMQRALKVDLDAAGEHDTYVDEELALLEAAGSPG